MASALLFKKNKREKKSFKGTLQYYVCFFLLCDVNEGIFPPALDILGLSPSTRQIKDLLAMYLCQSTPPSLWLSLWGEF